MCHVSCVMGHMSCVTTKMNIIFKIQNTKKDNVVELVGGGSLINGAPPSSLCFDGPKVRFAAEELRLGP